MFGMRMNQWKKKFSCLSEKIPKATNGALL